MGSRNETGVREENERDDQNRSRTLGSAGSESSIARDEQDRINYSSSSRGDYQREDFDQVILSTVKDRAFVEEWMLGLMDQA